MSLQRQKLIIAILLLILLLSINSFATEVQYSGPSYTQGKKIDDKYNIGKTRERTKIYANIEMQMSPDRYLLNFNGNPMVAIIPQYLFKSEITNTMTLELTGIFDKEWYSATIFYVESIKVIK